VNPPAKSSTPKVNAVKALLLIDWLADL